METVKDKSVGIVPIFKKDGDLRVLLIQHAKGHWSLPKGHPEGKETELETAKRELQEETNIKKVSLLPEARFEESYKFEQEGKKYHKTVVYYLGLVEGEAKVPSEFVHEIIDLKILTPDEALKLITYPEAKNILQQAFNYLELKI